MDHAEARELLELAAVEPGGFERLMAGDTAEASALAGHLAGCDDCSDEMLRLRRTGAVAREIVRSTAPADLRQRTLDLVAAVGRDRSGMVVAADAPVAAAAVAPAAADAVAPAADAPVAPGADRAPRSGGED